MSAAGRRRPERTRRRLALVVALLPSLTVPAMPGPPAAPAPAASVTPATPANAVTSANAVTPANAADVVGRAADADLIRSREWSLPALHIPQAWKWSKGAGVTVAVLDTGVDGRHPDLVGRVIQGPDYTGRGRRPGSRYWGRHGTAMASIIAGHGHGPGRAAGMVGVAPQAKILSIRVTWENDDPERADRAQVSRTRDAVAKGIRYAVDHGAKVINMSLGGGKMIYNGNPIEEDAVRYALGKGAMLIASAGNDGAGLNRTNFPAAYPGVTAVGAVDRALRPAKFTNRHDYVSVAAPGVDVISADVGRSYVQGTGTSPSAAIVAGIAALVRSHCPALSPEQTQQALQDGATHRPPGGRNTKIGAGVADALRAVYAGNRICKTPPPGQAAKAPPETAGAAVRAHASLPRIGFLGGGGLLLIVSLFMGWRQRRRRAREAYEGSYDVEPVESVEATGHHADDGPPPADPADTAATTVRRRRRAAPPRRTTPVDEQVWPQPTRPQPSRPQTKRPEPNRLPPTRTGLLAAPIALPEPPPPAPERDFGDDPLGTGYVDPAPEASTPLADQSWESVVRGRHRARPADGEPDGGLLDFRRFETRFRRPPES